MSVFYFWSKNLNSLLLFDVVTIGPTQIASESSLACGKRWFRIAECSSVSCIKRNLSDWIIKIRRPQQMNISYNMQAEYLKDSRTSIRRQNRCCPITALAESDNIIWTWTWCLCSTVKSASLTTLLGLGRVQVSSLKNCGTLERWGLLSIAFRHVERRNERTDREGCVHKFAGVPSSATNDVGIFCTQYILSRSFNRLLLICR